MHREPVVAGQFYPGSPNTLSEQVRTYLQKAEPAADSPTTLVMAPHAGYVFSGPVAGLALGEAKLADTVLLLGPNHTGLGNRLAVWSEGAWSIPGGEVPVDEDLAAALIDTDAGFTPDTAAHAREHSLEVMLPFLRAVNPAVRIVPVAVAEGRYELLRQAGETAANVIRSWQKPVSIVVSSDMSHYISHEQAQQRDRMALDKIEAMDPEGLYNTVTTKGITMCGVYPMTLGLVAAKALGAAKARVVAYDTSAAASGDYAKVVGYAGVLVQ